MMTVFFVVMTLCSGTEGCVDERKRVAYASEAECMETVNAMPARRGVKYRCHRGPQQLVSEVIRSSAPQPHLVTTNVPVTP
ncbi:MAG: hypothetical protein ACRYF9_11720 [Janthinobacterium lividum]|uniref:hypothetical protein n=1 Tax=Pseudomonas baltica TaxID=2762576 RepID=UPI0028A143DA|nr:hypothetical protein [Pseudomonas baltica]